MNYVVTYAAMATAFLVLDALWLGWIARDFYFSRLEGLVHDRPRLAPAAIFYALYIVGVIVFCIEPALKAGSWKLALVHGALFGFLAYATYDMTNLATLKNWPVSVALVDMAWGATITATVATVGFVVARQLFGSA
ncbi:MAG: DUF2177 family protein [Hyphomicrobiales bacterium]